MSLYFLARAQSLLAISFLVFLIASKPRQRASSRLYCITSLIHFENETLSDCLFKHTQQERINFRDVLCSLRLSRSVSSADSNSLVFLRLEKMSIALLSLRERRVISFQNRKTDRAVSAATRVRRCPTRVK